MQGWCAVSLGMFRIEIVFKRMFYLLQKLVGTSQDRAIPFGLFRFVLQSLHPILLNCYELSALVKCWVCAPELSFA